MANAKELPVDIEDITLPTTDIFELFDLICKPTFGRITSLFRRRQVDSAQLQNVSDYKGKKRGTIYDAEKGLKGVMVSINSFYLEYVPFERTRRRVEIGQEIFGYALVWFLLYKF